MHYPIKVSLRKTFELYVFMKLKCFSCCFNKPNQIKKLKKLYIQGQERIDADLNVEKIVKTLRNL